MKEIKQFDVIVLGGGLAGIYTALNIRSDLKIGLFIKDAGSSALHSTVCPTKRTLHFLDSLSSTTKPSFVLSAISASEANNVNLSLYGALAYGQKLLQLPHSLHI